MNAKKFNLSGKTGLKQRLESVKKNVREVFKLPLFPIISLQSVQNFDIFHGVVFISGNLQNRFVSKHTHYTYFSGYANDNARFVVRDNEEKVISALKEI